MGQVQPPVWGPQKNFFFWLEAKMLKTQETGFCAPGGVYDATSQGEEGFGSNNRLGTTHAVYLDFETYGCADLKQLGVRTYTENSSTGVTCLAYAVDSEAPQLWWPGTPLPAELQSALAAAHVVAHNYQFDRTVWRRFMVPLGLPEIPLARWDCTSFRARLARLPAGLDEAAEALGLAQRKDAKG